ncbi:MAG: DUF177 domain-containing protein [Syntrophomonadaceae bacterium]|nr:DUF177 domain-containing protein [Syntrophomonadaceae bacterium]
MKLDFHRLKLRPRESEEFYLQTQGDDKLLAGLGGKFISPLEIEIVVENTGTIFSGRGKLKTELQLPCSRCLRDFSFPLEIDFDLALVEESHNGQYSPDEGFIFFRGEEADIRSAVEEAIFMALPLSPLCRADCKGLCPICGQDLNHTACSCEEQDIDPRWEKLKQLDSERR